MIGNPKIALAKGRPLRPPYYSFKTDSPLLEKGKTISPLTDGFTGTAPDLGAIKKGISFTISIRKT